MASRVGIRDLRQNLSVFIERVKGGEVFEVTEHGRVVAKLSPTSERADPLERAIAEGWAKPATIRLRDLPRPRGGTSTEVSDDLIRMREQERW